MKTLSNELKGVISRRLELAGPREILAIASALCSQEAPAPEPVNTATRVEVPRFEIITCGTDEVVRDNHTGLMWTRGNVGSGRMTWQKAQKVCADLTYASESDWRLPTIKELLTLVDYERHDPAIDTEIFKCESAWYWSSTPAAVSPGDCAWGVIFNSGCTSWVSHNGLGFVRAVRVGQ